MQYAKKQERSFSHQSSAQKMENNVPGKGQVIVGNNLQSFQTNTERSFSHRNNSASKQVGNQGHQTKTSFHQTVIGQESPYLAASACQRPQTTDKVRNQIMNLQQAYNIKPQTAQNSHRLDNSQDTFRYSTPFQKKRSQVPLTQGQVGQSIQQSGQNTLQYELNTIQQGSGSEQQQFQQASNNVYQHGKPIGSQQTVSVSKGKYNQSNPYDTKLPQFNTPQPVKEQNKIQNQKQVLTQYQIQQMQIQQLSRTKQPQQVIQNYFGTSEKERQSNTINSQIKIKKAMEVSKKIDFSIEANIDNYLMLGEYERSSSSSRSSLKTDSPTNQKGNEKQSNNQLKQQPQSITQKKSQNINQNYQNPITYKQQKHIIQSNLYEENDSLNINQQKYRESSNQQRQKSPTDNYKSNKSKQPIQQKKLSETQDNFYKPSRSPYEKQNSQTLKNFYISRSKLQQEKIGSRKRIYSTNQTEDTYQKQQNTSYNFQKQPTSHTKVPKQLYENIDISLNPNDLRKYKQLSKQNSGEFEDGTQLNYVQNENEERKEQYHGQEIDHNFDILQFQNIQRPPCRKKINSLNEQGIVTKKGPVKPRHDIQIEDSQQNPLRPSSRHKLPLKYVGLGFSDSDESVEDIPVKEMFQRNQEDRNEIIYSQDTSQIKSKQQSLNNDSLLQIKTQDELISKTFNLNQDRPVQMREKESLIRPKSSRTNRSKSHFSKNFNTFLFIRQGTEAQIFNEPLFDDEINDENQKDMRFSINNYENIQDYNSEDQQSNSSDEREKNSSEQFKTKIYSIASKRLQGSDIVIKHNVSHKKTNLDKIQMPFETKLGVDFIGLFANSQDSDLFQNSQIPQKNQRMQSNDQQKLTSNQQEKGIFSNTSSLLNQENKIYDFQPNNTERKMSDKEEDDEQNFIRF